MVRSQHHQHPLVQAALPGCIAVVVLLSVLPIRGIAWLDGIGQLVNTAITPISHPLGIIARWLHPADESGLSDEEQETNARLEQYRSLYLTARDESDRLREVIRGLQSGRDYPASGRYQPLVFPVISNSSDAQTGVLRIRGGTSSGVTEQSSIATTLGLHLVGRVSQADSRFCTVIPITEPMSRVFLNARIMLADETGNTGSIRCQLTADGNGTLSGEATVPDPNPGESLPVSPVRGMVVRLFDESWPAYAQNLIVGTVVAVEPDPEQPLRPIVTVKPRVDLRRLGDVILRTPIDDSTADAANGTGGGP